MTKNLIYARCGYSIFFVLIGSQSVCHVSSNTKLSWVPEHIALVPGPVIIVSPAKNEEKSCGEIPEDVCLKKLQTFLHLKSLPYTSEESELDKLCRNTMAGYNCSAVKVTSPNCLSPRDKDMFPVFTDMAQYLVYMLCVLPGGNSGYLREDLLKNSECILKHKESLDCCADGSKLSDLPVMHILEPSSKSIKERQMTACCPIANYLKCAVPILKQQCGDVAANVTETYIRRASGEPVEATCQKMPNYPTLDSEICEAPPATCSGCRIGTLLELIILLVYFVHVKRLSD